MSEQDRTDWASSAPDEHDSVPSSAANGTFGTSASSEQASRGEYRGEYRHQAPHITQEPIDDVETEYVMPNRYTTVDQTQNGHKHMGVATSDPEYLPRTGPQVRQRPDASAANATGGKGGSSGTHRGGSKGGSQGSSPDYSRYLETPKSGRSIFISPKERRRKRNQKIACAVAIVAVIVVVVVLIVLS